MTKINHATSTKSENITGYDAERYKKIGEILAFMLTAFIIIGALPVFGLITLQVMLPMIALTVITTGTMIAKNYNELSADNDKYIDYIKRIAEATRDVFTL